MGTDDLAKVILFVVILLVALFKKKKEETPRKERHPGHDPVAHAPHRVPHAPAPHPPRPVARKPAPTKRRAPIGELGSVALPSQGLPELRPAHLVSTRHGGEDAPLGDRTRRVQETTAAAVSPGAAEREALPEVTAKALRAAVIWKEVLGPPRAAAYLPMPRRL